MPTPNPNLDLTTTTAIQSWLGPTQNYKEQESQIVQDLITRASVYFLHATGRGPANWDIVTGGTPTVSPFVKPVAYNETYDGNGNRRLYLRNWPIQSIQSLTIGVTAIPASSSYTQFGYLIDQAGKSISLRGGFGTMPGGRLTVGFFSRIGRGGPVFDYDMQNVNVQYTAGFSAIPFDVEMAVREMVGLTYVRRRSIDLKTVMIQGMGGGSTVYHDWELPPSVMSVIRFYKRRGLVAA